MFSKISRLLQNKTNPPAPTSFALSGIDQGHHEVTYRGIKAIKNPFDYLLYQMLIFQVQPDLIIEVGTHQGGNSLYLADLLNILNKGQVHTIDITNYAPPIVAQHPRIQLFNEGWENYDLSQVSDFTKVLVIEDSSHTYENTLQVLHKFAPVVTPQSYLIVEDGIVDALGLSSEFEGGPTRAIEEFLKQNKNFSIDRYWCDFFGKNATFNPNGYLQKKDELS